MIPAIAPVLRSVPPSAPAGASAPQCGIGHPVKPGCMGSVTIELEEVTASAAGSYELQRQPWRLFRRIALELTGRPDERQVLLVPC